MDSCTYCGEAADSLDHVIPRSWLNYGAGKGSEPGFRVPSCRQCNSILGDRLFDNLVKRKEYVHSRLSVKLKSDATGCIWDEDELAELGPSLRHCAEVRMAKMQIARDRLKFSAAPPDAKWLEVEERWRDLFRDERDHLLRAVP